jgi:arsenate reductase
VTRAEIEGHGIELLLDTVGERIDGAGHRVHVRELSGMVRELAYDRLIIATGATPGPYGAEVSKRLDVFAAAIFHGMQIDAVEQLDLSCTPPLSSPWDRFNELHGMGENSLGRKSMKTVLFACIHNAGRSQMAAAWFNALADRGKATAISAGTEPGARVHPEVLSAMREVGIELDGIAPQKLTDDLAATASILVTMGCGEACPVVPGLRRLDWPLEDPKAKPIERVREIRDDVRKRVAELLREQGWSKS